MQVRSELTTAPDAAAATSPAVAQLIGSTLPLGLIVITPGAREATHESGQDPAEFLRRHARGDWGAVSEADRAHNDHAVTNGVRILSAYDTARGERLWVITEGDRSATTLLLPDEY